MINMAGKKKKFLQIIVLFIFAVTNIQISFAASFFKRIGVKGDTYTNNKYGIEISKPSNWHFISGEELDSAQKRGKRKIKYADIADEYSDTQTKTLLAIHKYRPNKPNIILNPGLVLTVVELDDKVKLSPKEYLLDALTTNKIYIKDLEIIENPSVKIINAKEWNYSSYTGKINIGYLEVPFIQEIYTCAHQNKLFAITTVSTLEEHEKNKEQLNYVINGLAFR